MVLQITEFTDTGIHPTVEERRPTLFLLGSAAMTYGRSGIGHAALDQIGTLFGRAAREVFLLAAKRHWRTTV